MDAKHFPDRLRQLRTGLGLSQRRLAAAVGCLQPAVAKWESGDAEPAYAVLLKLCRVLRCKLEDLFEPPGPEPEPLRRGPKPKGKGRAKKRCRRARAARPARDQGETTMAKTCVVRPSPLHGRGLFACRAFRPGEVIEPVEGEIVLRESRSKYAIPLRGRRSLILTGKTRYINHAEGPANVAIRVRGMVGHVVALVDIRAGDELLAKYQGIF